VMTRGSLPACAVSILGAMLLALCPSLVAADDGEDLGAALEVLVEMAGGPPGGIAIVQRGDTLRVYSAGVGNLATGRVLLPIDHMRIASTAKAFSGAVALALVDQGVLGLDDTIGKWLPALPPAWAAGTLTQLLQHTSGLPDFLDSPGIMHLLEPQPTLPIDPSPLLTFVLHQDL